MDILGQIGAATTSIAEQVGAAIVSLGRDSRGTGVIVAPGTVLTNAHNLRDRTIQVSFADGRQAQAQARGVDVDGDLAVLSVETHDASPITWGEPARVRPGTPVFGVARRGSGLRTTFGMVSAVEQTFRGPRGRRVAGAFEHTAPLGRGSSGGAVTDADARLLGINTKRLGEGFYLAVPADADLRARVDRLSRGESPRRRRLGVGLAPSVVANRLRRSVGLPEREGLLVQAVVDGGPAAAAGVEMGDLIVAVDGRQVARIDDVMEALDAEPPSATATLNLVRGVDEREVVVTFEATPDEGR